MSAPEPLVWLDHPLHGAAWLPARMVTPALLRMLADPANTPDDEPADDADFPW